MSERLLVGTRRSALSRAQTELVVRAISARRSGIRLEARPMETSGDRDLRPGTSPDFTDALDRALQDGEVDLAVHSAKDLPLAPSGALTLAACPRRGDPRDCLVTARPRPFRPLPRGGKVGSSSLRRRAQLLRWRPDLHIVEIRGNVDSRLRRVRGGELDAAVLAVAGVRRLGEERAVSTILPRREFLPAPAQGALAIMARTGDLRATEVARTIDHPPTHAAVDAELAFARSLGGDCRLPLAALARSDRSTLLLEGEVLAPDGSVCLRASARGPSRQAAALGARLGRAVLDRGGDVLVASSRP